MTLTSCWQNWKTLQWINAFNILGKRTSHLEYLPSHKGFVTYAKPQKVNFPYCVSEEAASTLNREEP